LPCCFLLDTCTLLDTWQDQQRRLSAARIKPLHVDVVILQKGRTRPYIIEKELQRIQGAHSLDELKVRLLEAQEALEALNIFEAVQITVDAGSPVSKSLCCAVLSSCSGSESHRK